MPTGHILVIYRPILVPPGPILVPTDPTWLIYGDQIAPYRLHIQSPREKYYKGGHAFVKKGPPEGLRALKCLKTTFIFMINLIQNPLHLNTGELDPQFSEFLALPLLLL